MAIALAALPVCFALEACATAPQRHTDAIVPDSAVQIVVRNHHWLDVRVFVVRGGQRHRIGTVTAALTDRLTLPARLLESGRVVRLVAVPIGGRTTASTETLRVHPGQRIEWTLESDLARSSVAVW